MQDSQHLCVGFGLHGTIGDCAAFGGVFGSEQRSGVTGAVGGVLGKVAGTAEDETAESDEGREFSARIASRDVVECCAALECGKSIRFRDCSVSTN